MKSKLFRLNFRDLLRGGIVAVLTGGAQYLQIVFLDPVTYSAGHVFARCGWAALSALLAYLALNVNTNSTGEILMEDQK